VLCIAPDAESLSALRRASVGAEWELVPGASSIEEALRILEERHPHVVVAQGPPVGLIEAIRARVPYIRIVVVGERAEGADATVGSLEEVRDAIMGRSPAGGPSPG